MSADSSWASSEATRRTMQSNVSSGTKPELELRSLLFNLGLRYRVHVRPVKEIPYRADIVFTRARVAVFLHGCFWHGCERHYVAPKTHATFWAGKLADTRARDHRAQVLLGQADWKVLIVWEHDDLEEATRLIADVVSSRAPRKD